MTTALSSGEYRPQELAHWGRQAVGCLFVRTPRRTASAHRRPRAVLLWAFWIMHAHARRCGTAAGLTRSLRAPGCGGCGCGACVRSEDSGVGLWRLWWEWQLPSALVTDQGFGGGEFGGR